MLTKITHFVLFVHDQDAALDFYTKLGFSVHTDAMFGAMRWLTLNLPGAKDMELILMQAESDAEKALVGKQAADKPVITFESDNCLADYERLKALNVPGIEKPETQPWGTAFGFKDLYGNAIYVCQPSQ